MSAEIILLDEAETKNARAWLEKTIQEAGDSQRFVVLAIREWEENGKLRGACSVDCFNMNEFVFSWAAGKIADCAAEMRGRMVEE